MITLSITIARSMGTLVNFRDTRKVACIACPTAIMSEATETEVSDAVMSALYIPGIERLVIRVPGCSPVVKHTSAMR